MFNTSRPSIDPKREEYVRKCIATGDYATMELEQEPEYELIEVLVFFDFQPYEPMTRHYPGCDASLEICEVVRDDNLEEVCLLPEIKKQWEEQLLDDYEYRRGNDPRW